MSTTKLDLKLELAMAEDLPDRSLVHMHLYIIIRAEIGKVWTYTARMTAFDSHQDFICHDTITEITGSFGADTPSRLRLYLRLAFTVG
ncbi:hypothetical protein AC792_03910 [Arthrobacter sp. RIT-PI-e]|uniref:hypothetical protein n=1 Tax=Arthrobacter sp. RIT-PI-e TaxID=1681197 RepID=UPI0006768AD5|nr:hypothetical protein [Arthrobacter sp. RIT-PI-e]KNC19806.1 hypothetical protein AC792_03910 [Arthrobacter sp. RIT-PI-e]